MHSLALLCIAVLGLLVFELGFAISALRFRARQLIGHPDDLTNLLHKVVRAHGNTIEYATLIAVLSLYVGAHDPATLALGLVVAATLARLPIVVGRIACSRLDRPNPARFVGAPGTYLAGMASCAIVVGTA